MTWKNVNTDKATVKQIAYIEVMEERLDKCILTDAMYLTKHDASELIKELEEECFYER